MSEELYSNTTVDESVGQTPTAPATGGEAGRQPETAGQTPAQQPITAEEFKKYQANFDRRFEQQRRAAEAAQQEAYQARQQLLAYQQQLEQQQYAALPDDQKPHFENQRLRAQLQQMQQQAQQFQYQSAKQQAMLAMQTEAAELGITVSLDELGQQPNADDAWRYVLRKGAEAWRGNQAARQAKREANTVDLGGGAPVTPASDFQARYDKAVKNSDGKMMLDVMYEAIAAGVELNV